jgi:hypothetical protein
LRALVLHGAQTSGSPAARSLSEAGLLDQSPGVRLVAQRWLAERGVDRRERYETALPSDVTALHGLAEVAGRAGGAGGADRDEVAALVARYLVDERVRARSYAVQATGVLQGAAGVPILLAMLDDPSAGALRAVGRALARQRLGTEAVGDLWSRTPATDREAVRRAAFKVITHQDRWPRLVFACRAVAGASDRCDEDLRQRGERLLAHTSTTWNRSFTRPARAQLDELDRLVPIVTPVLPSTDARDLLHVLEHSR